MIKKIYFVIGINGVGVNGNKLYIKCDEYPCTKHYAFESAFDKYKTFDKFKIMISVSSDNFYKKPIELVMADEWGYKIINSDCTIINLLKEKGKNIKVTIANPEKLTEILMDGILGNSSTDVYYDNKGHNTVSDNGDDKHKIAIFDVHPSVIDNIAKNIEENNSLTEYKRKWLLSSVNIEFNEGGYANITEDEHGHIMCKIFADI